MNIKKSNVINAKRFIRTLSTHGYGQLITLVSTLALPSVFVANLTAQDYGYWVTVAALTQFFLFSDLGIANAISNQLCLHQSVDPNYVGILLKKTIREVIKRLSIGFFILSFVAYLVFEYLKTSTDADYKEYSMVFFFIGFSTLLQPVVGLYCAFQRYKKRNELGIFISNSLRLLEFLSIIISLCLFKSALIGVFFALIIKICAVFIFVLFLLDFVAKNSINSFEVSQISRDFNSTSKAGLGFSYLNLAQQVSIHAPVLIISSCIGPMWAAIFSSARTIARIPAQPFGIIFLSLNPELTQLFSMKKIDEFIGLVKKIFFTAIILTAIVGIFSIIFLSEIEKIWLHSKITIPVYILFFLGLSSTINMGAQSLSQSLGSINYTQRQGILLLGINILFLAIAWGFLYFKGNIGYMLPVMVFGDFLGMLVLIFLFKKAIESQGKSR